MADDLGWVAVPAIAGTLGAHGPSLTPPGQVNNALDGHPVHRSKAVRAFEQPIEGKLKIFLLPGYSPNLNPDELVWHYLKRRRLARAMVETKAQLIEQARSVLRSMQKRAALLCSFFRESHVHYVIVECPV